jgi:hypothetical protein
MLDIDDLMSGLFLRRRIFHSEADFQHALAWHIHETQPGCEVRLEFNASGAGERRLALDIWISNNRAHLAIELKYCTKLLALDWLGEQFALRDQSAQDTRRYDFLKDIQRVERVLDMREDANLGYAVLLTNDHRYWTPSTNTGAVDSAFRIHDGREVFSGNLWWSDNASVGTKRNREDPIQLKHSYRMRWRDYSSFGDKPGQTFRYLAIEIPPRQEITL